MKKNQSLMELTDAQKETVAKWASEGRTLAQIQNALREELSLNLTYMETRFLIDDLDVSIKDKEPPREARADAASPPPKAAGEAELIDAGGAPGGAVTVDVSKVVRPGALVSGSVTFSDGETAEWHVDQMGRLGLSPKTQGYQPSPEDLQAFQRELQAALESSGMQ